MLGLFSEHHKEIPFSDDDRDMCISPFCDMCPGQGTHLDDKVHDNDAHIGTKKLNIVSKFLFIIAIL